MTAAEKLRRAGAVVALAIIALAIMAAVAVRIVERVSLAQAKWEDRIHEGR